MITPTRKLSAFRIINILRIHEDNLSNLYRYQPFRKKIEDNYLDNWVKEQYYSQNLRLHPTEKMLIILNKSGQQVAFAEDKLFYDKLHGIRILKPTEKLYTAIDGGIRKTSKERKLYNKPIINKHKITSSERGLQEGFIRATFIIDKKILNKLKNTAIQKRVTLKEIVEQAFIEYLEI